MSVSFTWRPGQSNKVIYMRGLSYLVSAHPPDGLKTKVNQMDSQPHLCDQTLDTDAEVSFPGG